VKAGNNTLTIVVANLIANEMKWSIFDETLTSRRARRVHDLSLLREPDKLVSGLAGPVRIVPLKKRWLRIQPAGSIFFSIGCHISVLTLLS